jgi:hypothetical protein
MFWRKKQAVTAGGAPAAAPTGMKAEGSKPKAKKLSRTEILTNEVEQLTLGQEIGYLIPSPYGDRVYFVKYNPDYPDKGKKYSMSTDNIVNGKLTGNRMPGWNTNSPKDVAKWILSNLLGESDGVPKKWEG